MSLDVKIDPFTQYHPLQPAPTRPSVHIQYNSRSISKVCCFCCAKCVTIAGLIACVSGIIFLAIPPVMDSDHQLYLSLGLIVGGVMLGCAGYALGGAEYKQSDEDSCC